MNLAKTIAPAIIVAFSTSQAFADTAILTVSVANEHLHTTVIPNVSTKVCENIAKDSSNYGPFRNLAKLATVTCISEDGKSSKGFVCNKGACTATMKP